jgi:hypothetical protein
MQGYLMYQKLRSVYDYDVEAAWLINIEMERSLRLCRDFCMGHDLINGNLPPMYGIPFKLDNSVKEMQLWVRLK